MSHLAIKRNLCTLSMLGMLLASINVIAQPSLSERIHSEEINKVVSVKDTRQALILRFESGGKKYVWKNTDYYRDSGDGFGYQYDRDLWITGGVNSKYLLFFGFSGGAHCCWAVLQFNLQNGKYEGDHLGSMGPMEAIGGNKKCPFRIRTVLFIEKYALSPNPPQQTFCFENGKFKLLNTRYFKHKQ